LTSPLVQKARHVISKAHFEFKAQLPHDFPFYERLLQHPLKSNFSIVLENFDAKTFSIADLLPA
jgi:hypothetical protein